MQAQRQFVAGFLFLFLLIAVPFGRDSGVRAQPPLPENGETAVGTAVQIVGVERTVAAANNFTFLPMVTGVSGTSGGGGEISAEALRVVELTNAERAQAGCAPLNVSTQLTEAAQGHSEDMALNDFFSHTGSDGRSPGERIEAAGYDYWTTIGENIAAGYQTPEAVMAGWMGSKKGHRENILNCAYEDIGVGYYYLADDTGEENYHTYWTQDFGSR
jgi:uncharacterized protein YkwD